MFVHVIIVDKEEKPLILIRSWSVSYTHLDVYKRQAMDREVTVIEGMDELLRELRYQGNNLNQLTVMARQGRITQVNYEPLSLIHI